MALSKRWVNVCRPLILSVGLFVFAVGVRAETADESVRVLFKAKSQALLSSQIAGVVNVIPFTEGERFKKGDVLVSFDCRLMKARLDVARAALIGEQKALTNKRRRLQLQSAGTLEVELAKAATAKARGEFNAAKYLADQCEIKAPFDGRVTQRPVQAFETVAPGDPLIGVLDDSVWELELVIPSAWLSWLQVGQAFNVTVDETGKSYPASIVRLGAQIDPVSQTVNVYGHFDDASAPAELIAGMSGTAHFTQKN